MKTHFDEYLKIIMYTIFGILFAMSIYLIVLNIHHSNSLTSIVNVSDLDNDYVKYKDNVTIIEEKLAKNVNASALYKALSKAVKNMKNGGVFRLVPKTKLSYKDLYEINDYFMEELINNSWVHNIKELDNSLKYQEIISMLVNNSNYINRVFTNNSLTLYDSNLTNSVEDNYHFIINNYLMYSNVILSLCDEIGGANG